MSHKRNIAGLKASTASKKESTRKKAEEAIAALLKAKSIINFNTVAEKAGVSKAWLYREKAVADRVRRLRDRQSGVVVNAHKESERTSDASKSALITTLKARVKELESEKAELKKQLEIVYGRLHDATS